MKAQQPVTEHLVTVRVAGASHLMTPEPLPRTAHLTQHIKNLVPTPRAHSQRDTLTMQPAADPSCGAKAAAHSALTSCVPQCCRYIVRPTVLPLHERLITASFVVPLRLRRRLRGRSRWEWEMPQGEETEAAEAAALIR